MNEAFQHVQECGGRLFRCPDRFAYRCDKCGKDVREPLDLAPGTPHPNASTEPS